MSGEPYAPSPQAGAPQQLLLLAGGGHVHALLLARWARHRHQRPRLPVLLISRSPSFLYSGLLPAVVAGLLPPAAARIDLRGLCRRAEVGFLQAEITGLDPQRRWLWLAEEPPLAYTWLSLDVGGVSATSAAGEQPLRPLEAGMEALLAWVATATATATATASAAAPPLVLRGGGASALELALALRARGLEPRLLLRGRGLRLGSPRASRRGEGLLQAAGIPLERGAGPARPAQLACTGSRAPAWLAAGGLPVDPASGRVRTDPSLRVLGQPAVFAAGDCALVEAHPRPAAGVWAVRAAAPLARNLARAIAGPGTLVAWRPPRHALQLIGDGGAITGRPRALACWGPLVLGPSRLLWWLKLALDRRFVTRLRRQGG